MKIYGSLAIAALAAALALVAGGCGGGEAESAGPVPTNDEPITHEPEVVKPYRVWFTRGEHLFAVTRRGPETEGVGAEAVRILLDGPTAAEGQAGVSSAIPAGTRFLGLEIIEGTATVDLRGLGPARTDRAFGQPQPGGEARAGMSKQLPQFFAHHLQCGPSIQGQDVRADGTGDAMRRSERRACGGNATTRSRRTSRQRVAYRLR